MQLKKLILPFIYKHTLLMVFLLESVFMLIDNNLLPKNLVFDWFTKIILNLQISTMHNHTFFLLNNNCLVTIYNWTLIIIIVNSDMLFL